MGLLDPWLYSVGFAWFMDLTNGSTGFPVQDVGMR
jgi:hypothetical protein